MNEEENKKYILRAQESIRKLPLEDLAENLYNAEQWEYYWKGRKEIREGIGYPFYIDHRGTHASYEVIIPNVNETYSVSDESIKRKIIDSVSWLIDNYGKPIRVGHNYKENREEFDKINYSRLDGLLQNFSGNSETAFESHEFKGQFLLEENSEEMKNYIKEKFRNSFVGIINNKLIDKKFAYSRIRPMEFLPDEKWIEAIKEGYGGEVLFSKIRDTNFFGSKEFKLDISDFFSLGLNAGNVDNFINQFDSKSFGICYYRDYINEFGKIKDESIKKEFLEVLDNFISEKGWLREGNEIIFDKIK